MQDEDRRGGVVWKEMFLPEMDYSWHPDPSPENRSDKAFKQLRTMIIFIIHQYTSLASLEDILKRRRHLYLWIHHR